MRKGNIGRNLHGIGPTCKADVAVTPCAPDAVGNLSRVLAGTRRRSGGPAAARIQLAPLWLRCGRLREGSEAAIALADDQVSCRASLPGRP